MEGRLKPQSLLPSAAEVGDIVTASAQLLYGTANEQFAIQYKSWQHELWAYSKSIGEYGSVMNWYAAGISRMHLTVAVQRPGIREPEPLDGGPAADLMHQLTTQARGGETQFLRKWGRHIGIPGTGFLVGEDDPTKGRVFDVKSADQIRRSTEPFRDAKRKIIRDRNNQIDTGFDVRTSPNEWRKLPYESIVGRIYDPDDELDYLETSWSRPALTTLREIDLYNRHIVATLLSRLVFNGILLIPEEVSFPVNPQFKDAPDPFIAELIAVASRGIKDPGSPASALPLPLRVKSEFIESFKHLIVATGVDSKVIESRAAAIGNLSKMLPAPPEALNGKSEMNHWNAWQDSEDNVKMYFGPTMEIICGGITDIYLHPLLRALGESIDSDGGRIICWYDDSDLVQKPDNSANAMDAREREVITDEAYLEQLGLDGADVPDEKTLRRQLLVTLARQGMPIPDSFYLLYPEDKPAEPAIDPATGAPLPGAGPSAGGAPVAVDAPNGAPGRPPGAADGGRQPARALQPTAGG